MPGADFQPGAVIAVQTFGGLLEFNPHFHVHTGPRILPRHAESMENLARYIIRASFAQERMTYLPREARLIYESRDGKQPSTPWNGSRPCAPTVLHPDEASSAPSRKELARMIQKIYEVDPLICPKCSGAMRILAFIEDQDWIPACPRPLPGKTSSTRTRGSPSTGLHSTGDVSLPNSMRPLLDRCSKAQIRSIIDGTAGLYDPEGVNSVELDRIVLREDLEGFDPVALNPGGFMLFRRHRRQEGVRTLYRKASRTVDRVEEEWITSDEFNREMDELLCSAPADLFLRDHRQSLDV